KPYRRSRGFRRLVPVAMLLLVASAAAQGPGLRDIEKHIQLCSRLGDIAPDERISSCTALIESGADTPRTLAIAHNNRGNGYFRKGEYDSAIEDYDKSIKALPQYAKAFNNRGVAYQKKG